MKTDVYVVHKKAKERKFTLTKFENTFVDDILSETKRKPLIPYNEEIEAIGVGSLFEERFKRKYGKKIKNV